MKTIFDLKMPEKEEKKEIEFSERISDGGYWEPVSVNPKSFDNSILISEDKLYIYCLCWQKDAELRNTSIFRGKK